MRCSPYHQNSALAPVIEHLQRPLTIYSGGFAAEQTAETSYALRTTGSPKPRRCRCWPRCCRYRIQTVCNRLTFSPQKQKEKTQEALVAWIVEEAEAAGRVRMCGKICIGLIRRRLELLALFLQQVPTSTGTGGPHLSPGLHAAVASAFLSSLSSP